MADIVKLDRRDFLKIGAMAGGGLLLGVYLPDYPEALAGPPLQPNVFVRIDTDEAIAIWVGKADMGQGVRTSLPMIVADELDADWSKVRVIQADAHPNKYGRQITVGSGSVRGGAWNLLRQAGATGRAMLKTAAAARWGVAAGECTTKNGYVIHEASGRKLSYGEVTEAAAELDVPENAALKDKADFTLTGKNLHQVDTAAKVTGESEFGIDVPISHSQDSTGPMTRSVADAAIILGTLTGIDPRDPLTAPSQGNALTDYTQALDPDGLDGARIGVARAYAGFDDRVDRLLEEALDVMKRQGATIVDPIELPAELRFGNEFEMEVLYYEFKADLNAYLDSLGPDAPVKSLKEVIEHNEANADLELSLFGQELLIGSEERGPLSEPRYVEALGHSHRLSRAEGIDRVMVAERLDAIVGPTSGPAALLDPLGARGGSGGGCSTPSAMAGYPNMTLPMGFIFGLPVGISLFGRAWTESTLIRLAYGYEQATKHRRPPKFLPTMDVTA